MTKQELLKGLQEHWDIYRDIKDGESDQLANAMADSEDERVEEILSDWALDFVMELMEDIDK